MDTRRVAGTRESFGSAAELGTETVPVELVELSDVRSIVTARRAAGSAAILSTVVVLGVMTVIALLAIATSAGWSILDAY